MSNVVTGTPKKSNRLAVLVFKLTPNDSILLAVCLYILSAIFAFMFFQGIASILAGQKLVTSEVRIVLRAIAIPLLLFSLFVVCLSFALVAWRSRVAAALVGISFIIGRQIDLIAFLDLGLVLLAIGIYYKMFFSNLESLKKPRISKAAQSSFGLFLLIMSLAISTGFYHIYAARAAKVSDSVAKVATAHFKAITTAISDLPQGQPETFKAHMEHYLKSKNLPATEAAISSREKDVSAKLGITASPSESYQAVINRAIAHQVNLILRNYKALLVVLVPLAFFFITQTFTSVASYVIFGLIYTTEYLLLRCGYLRAVEDA